MPNWDAVGERLRKERQENLPGMDTSEAIREFKLAWKAATAGGMQRQVTGLIEQQARFSLLRGPSS